MKTSQCAHGLSVTCTRKMKTSRTLVISEEPELIELLTPVFEARGGRVVACGVGGLARGAVRALAPDLIVVDLAWGDPAGIEFIRRLQRWRETRAIPVVALADSGELEDHLLQIFDFLVKPVDLERLREDILLIGKRSRRSRGSVSPEPFSDSELRLFGDFLAIASGLRFDRGNSRILERGLSSRMAALKFDSYADYFDFLVRNQEQRGELHKLLQFLTVGETCFFRYPYHFDALRRQILPAMVAKGQATGRRRLRIWSAGCSTGEEPYSLAIAVLESVPKWWEWDIRIVATDINSQALRRAREGVYTARSVRLVEPPCLASYFHQRGEQWALKDEVKRLVTFAHLNLQSGIPDLVERDFDIVFCRNVLIYFEPGTVKRLVEGFTDCLLPGGYLFLGHSESLFRITNLYERIAHGGGFYYRKRNGLSGVVVGAPEEKEVGGLPAALLYPSAESGSELREPGRKGTAPSPVPEKGRESFRGEEPAPPSASIHPPPPSVEEMYRQARFLYEAEKYDAAAELLDRVLAQQPDHLGGLLTRCELFANQGLVAEALATCDAVIACNDLVAEAYLLRGLVLEMDGQPEDAADEYRKAILLDMGAVIPHCNLGRLYLRLGRERDGVRELKNSLKMLAQVSVGEVVPFSGGLTRDVLMDLLQRELSREPQRSRSGR